MAKKARESEWKDKMFDFANHSLSCHMCTLKWSYIIQLASHISRHTLDTNRKGKLFFWQIDFCVFHCNLPIDVFYVRRLEMSNRYVPFFFLKKKNLKRDMKTVNQEEKIVLCSNLLVSSGHCASWIRFH